MCPRGFRENTLISGYPTSDMSERSDQRERSDTAVDDELLRSLSENSETESPVGLSDDQSPPDSTKSKIRRGARSTLITTLLTGVGLGIPATIGNLFVPLIGGPVGLLAGGALLGGLSKTSYPLTGIIGAVFGALSVLLGNIPVAVAADAGVELALVGAGVGLAIAVLGLYLGRDFKAGLTKEL